MKAYTYAENADGTYDIGDDVENAGTAKLLKNGTVDSSLKGYIALSGKPTCGMSPTWTPPRTRPPWAPSPTIPR